MQKMLLFNPGPTNVSEEVRNALCTPDICHREPEFFEVLRRVNQNLIKILNGERTHSAVLFVSSGTGCNEAVINSIHGKALVVNNGKYSDRLCEIAERFSVPLTRVTFDPLQPVEVAKVEEALVRDPEITHILLVHHETTTGALAPLHEIGEIAEKYGKLLVVDTISGLGAHPLDLQKDHIAFCTVSANKGLESFPGISFVIGRTEEIKKLKGKSRSFYFDLYTQWEKGEGGETPYTPAVQLVFALDRALQNFIDEGYDQRVKRYRKLSERMRQGLKSMGFELILFPPTMHSNILTTIKMPSGFDYWKVHDALKIRGITIYSDKNVLAQGRFRVATLGSITEADVDWFLKNLKEVLEELDLWPLPQAI